MIVLTYNPNVRLQNKIDPKYYKEVKLEDFVHKVYIECARELWNNPYLMYHQYPPIELKRNQRDTMNLIKDAIREAIRKLLPLKEILEIYLGDELEPNNIPDFDRNITEAEERNIQKLINKDLKEEFNNNLDFKEGDKLRDFKQGDLKPNDLKQQGGNDSQSTTQKDLNSKILEIINNKSNNDHFSPKKLTADLHSENYANKSSSDTPMTKATKTLSNTSDSNSSHSNHSKMTGGNVDDKIKKVLENDLGASDLETSLSYRAETNDKDYQEIFANSLAPQPAKNQHQNGGNSIKDSSKNKRKFFNNYLNI
jgi:hypothetical protein